MNVLDAISRVFENRLISISQTGLGGIEDRISERETLSKLNKIRGLYSVCSTVLVFSKSIFRSVISSSIDSQCSLPTNLTCSEVLVSLPSEASCLCELDGPFGDGDDAVQLPSGVPLIVPSVMGEILAVELPRAWLDWLFKRNLTVSSSCRTLSCTFA